MYKMETKQVASLSALVFQTKTVSKDQSGVCASPKNGPRDADLLAIVIVFECATWSHRLVKKGLTVLRGTNIALPLPII